MPQTTRRTLVSGAAATALLAGAPLMASITTDDPIDHYLTLSTVGAWHMLRINDVTLSRSSRFEGDNYTLPIDFYLRGGLNTLSATLITSGTGDDPGTEPNPSFGMTVHMYRLNLVTREREEITLMNIAFDMETGRLQLQEQTRSGFVMAEGREGFGRIGPLRETTADFIDGYGPPAPGVRAEISFALPDDIPVAPYANAEPLEDTVEVRKELAAAYANVHDALASRNFDRIRQLFLPAWTHIAAALHYEDVDELIKVADSQRIMTEPEGVLAPLATGLASEANLELMAKGRLIRFLHAPLYTQDPDTGDYLSEYPVAFYKGVDGRFEIGAVLLS